jgi:hypothetical protein
VLCAKNSFLFPIPKKNFARTSSFSSPSFHNSLSQFQFEFTIFIIVIIWGNKPEDEVIDDPSEFKGFKWRRPRHKF